MSRKKQEYSTLSKTLAYDKPDKPLETIFPKKNIFLSCSYL